MVRDNVLPLNGWPATTEMPYDSEELKIVAYCAEEVRRQRDSQWHVFRMYQAWKRAQIWYSGTDNSIRHSHVRVLGELMDEENQNGYRNGPIWIGGKPRTHHGIHSMMTDLLDRQDILTPEQFYLEFEYIHPFFDGNGRTGKVLYNWKRGSLHDPVWPPDFFGGIENP